MLLQIDSIYFSDAEELNKIRSVLPADPHQEHAFNAKLIPAKITPPIRAIAITLFVRRPA